LRRWGGREGVEWVVREGVGVGGRNDPNLYAHMNNKLIKKKKRSRQPGNDMSSFGWGTTHSLFYSLIIRWKSLGSFLPIGYHRF
jgi:hypothetical protein